MTDFLIDGHFDHSISPLDRGLAYGDGLFETIKVIAASPRYWQYHLNRLFDGAERLRFDIDRVELTRQLTADVQNLLAKSAAAEECIKIQLTRGVGQRGYTIPAVQQPVRIVQRTVANPKAADFNRDGIDLFLCELRLAKQPALAGIKHLNRLEQVLARAEWQDDFQEGVLRDTDDHVIEGVMSNLFLVESGTLVTPNLDQAGVAGILRSRIIRWAETVNIPVNIESVSLPRLQRAEHIFLCNSLNGVWPVNRFCQRRYVHADFHLELSDWLAQDSRDSVAQFNNSL